MCDFAMCGDDNQNGWRALGMYENFLDPWHHCAEKVGLSNWNPTVHEECVRSISYTLIHCWSALQPGIYRPVIYTTSLQEQHCTNITNTIVPGAHTYEMFSVQDDRME